MEKITRNLLSLGIAIMFVVFIGIGVSAIFRVQKVPASQILPNVPYCDLYANHIKDNNCEAEKKSYNTDKNKFDQNQKDIIEITSQNTKKHLLQAEVALVVAMVVFIFAVMAHAIKDLSAGLVFGSSVVSFIAITFISAYDFNHDIHGVVPVVLMFICFIVFTFVLVVIDRFMGSNSKLL